MKDLTSAILIDCGNTLIVDAPGQKSPIFLKCNLRVVEHAPTALQALSAIMPIHLATNSSRCDENQIRLAMLRVNLSPYIQHIFCSKTIGCKKTDPRYFEHIIKFLGVKPENLFMIGDSFENDVLPAVKAGLHALWLNLNDTTHRQGPLFSTVFSMNELLEFFVNLN